MPRNNILREKWKMAKLNLKKKDKMTLNLHR